MTSLRTSSRRSPSIFAVLALGLCVAAPAMPQAPYVAPLVERIDVQLVVVDVFVTADDGSPLSGLGREDFEVLEDGTPVEIRQFTGPTEAGPGSTQSAADTDSAGEAPQRLVVFVDELHLHPHHRIRVLQQLRAALKRDKSELEVMMARFDGQLRIVQPFTRDREQVLAALDAEIDVRRISMLNAFTETEQTLRYLESLQYQNVEGADFGDACTQNGHIARKHAQQAHTLALQSIAGMMRMVGSLSGETGRKALLHVSDGIPMMPGTKVYGFAAELCDGTGAINGLENAVDTQQFGTGKNTRWNPKLAAMELAEFEISKPWRQLGALANTHQVSIYPLQAEGLTTGGRAKADGTRISMRTELDARNSVREALQLIADDTGGRALFDTNDFRTAVRGVLDEGSGFYQLAYAPPNPGDGLQHRIDVRTPGRETKIRHRGSYLSQSLDQQLADVVISALVHRGEDNPLDARLSIGRVQDETPQQQRATLKIEVPLGALARVPRDGSDLGEFTVAVGIMDRGDRIRPIGSKTIRVVIPPEPTEQDYVYDVEIDVDRKGGIAAVAIRDDVEDRVSYFSRDLHTHGSLAVRSVRVAPTLGLGLALTLGGLAAGQQPDRALTEGSVDESLVVREATLHVRVRTPRKAIEGLAREQFRVLLEGRELEVVAFEELSTGEPDDQPTPGTSGESAAAVPAPASRSLLYVFDFLWSPPQYLVEAVQAARRNPKNLGPEDQVAILSLDSRARLLHPFTRDRAVAAAGLDLLDAMLDRDGAAVRSKVRQLQERVAADPSYDMSSSLGLRAALGIDLNRNLVVTALAETSLFADRPPARFDDGAGDPFAIATAGELNRTAQTIQASNDAFADALRLVSDVPGPRYSFLFSTGVPAFSQLIAIQPGSTVYDVVEGSGAAVLGSFQSLSYILQAHGWTVQAIDISGVGRRSLGAFDTSTGPRPEQNSLELAAIPDLALRGGLADAGSDSLFFLAEETGGDLYQQDNNLGGALRRSLEATSHSYRVVVSLGGELTLADGRRTLDVKVSGIPRRARVTHSVAAAWALPKNLRARDRSEVARDELLRGRGELALSPDAARLGVFEVPFDGPSRRLVVVVDTTAAVFAAHPRRGQEHLLVLQALALPADPVGDGAQAQFHDFFRTYATYPTGDPTRRIFLQGDLIAPCTPTTVRVRLSTDAEEESAVLEHRLGGGCDEPIRWATPLHDASDGFFFVREAGFALEDPQQNPFRIDGATAFPALRSMRERGDGLQLLSYSAADRAGDAAPPLRLVRSDGSSEELPVESVTSADPNRRLLGLTLDVPAGRYDIQWGAGPPTGPQVRILDFSAP